MMSDNKNSLPIMSHDPNDRIMQAMRRYDPHFINYSIRQITDFPVASDNELLLHYLRGVAGPFIDVKSLCRTWCGLAA